MKNYNKLLLNYVILVLLTGDYKSFVSGKGCR